MKNQRSSSFAQRSRQVLVLALFLAAASVVFSVNSHAQDPYTQLYSFTGGADGGNPLASLVFDKAGNLYGTTSYGNGGYNCYTYGTGCGTVFKVAFTYGHWQESVLYTFTGNADGSLPSGNLIFDKAGNLYGTASLGGDPTANCGVIFKLTPRPSGEWKEQVLYTFPGSNYEANGCNPGTGLVFDRKGNLYGTTNAGGLSGIGVVFELSTVAHAAWNFKVLYSFGKNDPPPPYSSLALDQAGNLYWTDNSPTSGVFELSPTDTGNWQEALIFQFAGYNGWLPSGPVIFDQAGNLYGVTFGGGPQFDYFGCESVGCGTVYELSPSQNGQWTQTTLYYFPSVANTNWDNGPVGGLVFDSSGNLYGALQGFCGQGVGGSLFEAPGCGSIFELSPGSGGTWTASVRHVFGYGTDGAAPAAGLIRDSKGALYGTTEYNGISGYGGVFRFKP